MYRGDNLAIAGPRDRSALIEWGRHPPVYEIITAFSFPIRSLCLA